MSGVPSRTIMPQAEAEEFMALLIAAQNTEHNCAWCRYFKKIGRRITQQYLGTAEAKLLKDLPKAEE